MSLFEQWTIGPTFYAALIIAEAFGSSNTSQIIDLQANSNNIFTPAYGIYEKILKGKIYWPKEVDPLSKDIIKAFLHPDRSKRLGNLIGGSQDVLDHP